MAALTIRKLDPLIKRRLRLRATRNGRSMEEEARAILKAAVVERPEVVRLGSSIRTRFARAGGVELELPVREPMRSVPRLR